MIRQTVFVALIAMGLSGCNTSYNYFQAEAEEDTGPAPTLFGTLLQGAGVAPKNKSAMATQPRAPLAIPSAADLPAPRQTSVAEASVQFPVDDDEVRRQRQARGSLVPGDEAFENRVSDSGSARIDATGFAVEGEIAPQRTVARDIDTAEQKGNFRLSRAQLRQTFTGGKRRNTVLTENGEAQPRTFLVQPPVEYRTPSQTAALPTKKEIQNSKWLKDRLYKREDKRPPRAIK